MCIICLEFNRLRDIGDAQMMIEAARREANSIAEAHLQKIEKKLLEMDSEAVEPLEIDDQT